MRPNKVNNREALKLVGPCRPHDIIKMEQKSVEIAWIKDNRAQIIFKKSYLKCGDNHILVNENFDSLSDLSPIIKVILPNSNVHIFIDDFHCDVMGLLPFCDRISHTECVKIMIHLSKNCRFREYIEKYFPKLTHIKFTLCNITANAGVDFWCTDYYDWQSNRDVVIADGVKSIKMSTKSQFVNGICVRLSPFHGLVRHQSFDVVAIQSRFIGGWGSKELKDLDKRSDTFELMKQTNR